MRHDSDKKTIEELEAQIKILEKPEKLSVLVELELEQLKSTLQRKERLISSKDKQLETHLATIKAHDQCMKREKE